MSILIKPFVNRELMPFAEESFHRFLGKMAMARADIDHERLGRRCGSGQRFAEPLINRLPNHVLHHGTMRRRFRVNCSTCSHDNDHI